MGYWVVGEMGGGLYYYLVEAGVGRRQYAEQDAMSRRRDVWARSMRSLRRQRTLFQGGFRRCVVEDGLQIPVPEAVDQEM